MPRTVRRSSSTGFYHVTIRGVDKCDIFLDDKDRIRFLEALRQHVAESDTAIHAWCLMGNHIHLLIESNTLETLSLLMQRVVSAYVWVFNKLHDRVGPLLQDRFWSCGIESDAQFLATVRYIHLNPQAAGICPAKDYRWSSYQSYVKQQGTTETDKALEMLGSVKAFIEFHEGEQELLRSFLDSERPVDAEALRQAMETALNEAHLSDLRGLKKKERDPLIKRLHEAGYSVAEISRATEISRTTVHHALS